MVDPTPVHRISVSFDQAQYDFIRTYSEQHRVSLAWTVREAVQSLMDEHAPLFRNLKQQSGTESPHG